MAIVLGITGGIGTGKSTVLQMLHNLGALTVSADEISHEIMQKDTPAYNDTVQRFSREILRQDMEIDRAALAHIVFNDAQARKDLEEITHPRIIDRINQHIQSFRNNPPFPDSVLAVEIPLLIECGLEGIVDKVLLVGAEQETQICRLTNRRGVSREEAISRIQAQMPLEYKIKCADWVIWNDGDLSSLEQSVKHFWEEIHLL